MWNQFSVTLEGVTLEAPDYSTTEEPQDDTADEPQDDNTWDDDDTWDNPNDAYDNDGRDNLEDPVQSPPTRGCSTIPASAPAMAWLLLPLLTVFRRRE